MPTGARKRKRAAGADKANNDTSRGNSQQACNNNSNGSQDPNVSSGSPTDGARNPLTPGAEYTSLRRITRRLPDDPEHLLDGVDTTAADLSWTARDEADDINPKTGQPWLFPKRRGRREGSNLEDFRQEIEERTKNGQGCKAISDALVEKGVDTSVRAVARQRMKWGLRQRAPRRMTEQGIANIRKAHLEQAKRMANKDPVPVKRVRIRVMRKAEIIRMTNEGMSPAQIAENLQARGVKLKRGAATVERLRTVWGLVPDSQRNTNNLRQFCRNQALRLQKAQFENIAIELGIEDVKAWVKSKMDEDVAQDARREHGYKLMGHLRPNHVHVDRSAPDKEGTSTIKAMGDTTKSNAESEGVDTLDQLAASASSRASSGPGAAHNPIELSDDEAELDSEGDEDAGDDQEAPATALKPQFSSLAMELDHPEPVLSQSGPAVDLINQSLHLPGAGSVPVFVDPQANQATLVQPSFSIVTTDPSFTAGMCYPQYWPQTNMQEVQPGSDANGQEQPSHPVVPQQPQQQTPAEDYNAAPLTPGSFQPPSQGLLEPRAPVQPPVSIPGSTTHRLIAPKPPQVVVQPSSGHSSIAPRLSPVITPPGEAELMAKYGLYPFATFKRPPQKYLTPSGLITTEGYEYLPCARGFPGLSGSMSDSVGSGGPPPPPQQQQLQGSPQPTLLPQNYIPPQQSSNSQHLPPGVIMVPPPAPPKISKIPAPPLVIPLEEAERHRASHSAVDLYHKAALECMEYLAARADARPVANSLTGMPPSLKDVEDAKGRLKEAAGAMLAAI
ncbi:hypothetical protein N8I77_013438 [Diaporthe amygdali]|uniref:Uncharacterized protein n=1 Tax=Phomopsis amygdali TaxID=1214568 RepID=A0AAD9S1F7_PHOAM|nr:hypothetical protein N8I77_013438 [Diaporthe amygdali]